MSRVAGGPKTWPAGIVRRVGAEPTVAGGPIIRERPSSRDREQLGEDRPDPGALQIRDGQRDRPEGGAPQGRRSRAAQGSSVRGSWARGAA